MATTAICSLPLFPLPPLPGGTHHFAFLTTFWQAFLIRSALSLSGIEGSVDELPLPPVGSITERRCSVVAQLMYENLESVDMRQS